MILKEEDYNYKISIYKIFGDTFIQLVIIGFCVLFVGSVHPPFLLVLKSTFPSIFSSLKVDVIAKSLPSPNVESTGVGAGKGTVSSNVLMIKNLLDYFMPGWSTTAKTIVLTGVGTLVAASGSGLWQWLFSSSFNHAGAVDGIVGTIKTAATNGFLDSEHATASSNNDAALASQANATGTRSIPGIQPVLRTIRSLNPLLARIGFFQ